MTVACLSHPITKLPFWQHSRAPTVLRRFVSAATFTPGKGACRHGTIRRVLSFP